MYNSTNHYRIWWLLKYLKVWVSQSFGLLPSLSVIFQSSLYQLCNFCHLNHSYIGASQNLQYSTNHFNSYIGTSKNLQYSTNHFNIYIGASQNLQHSTNHFNSYIGTSQNLPVQCSINHLSNLVIIITMNNDILYSIWMYKYKPKQS